MLQVYHEWDAGNVKAKETISMIKNVPIPFIEAEDCKDKNVHAFEIIYTDLVLDNTIMRRSKILETIRIAAKCFLEREIPF
jgi:hypothetical protein